MLLRRPNIFALCIATLLLIDGPVVRAESPPPEGLTPIGGHWFEQAGETPVYFYQDGDRYLDLFTDHAQDSNKDGIPNLKLSPGTLARGRKHSVQIELNPQAARRVPVPAGVPSRAQVGPYEALQITREGNIVTIEIEVPEDSPVGVLFDCHIEFGEKPPTVFKKNDVLRVGE